MNEDFRAWNKAVQAHCAVPAWMGYLLFRFRVPLDWRMLNATTAI